MALSSITSSTTSSFVFPPAPNWFSSHSLSSYPHPALGVSDKVDHLTAYAARNHVVFYRPQTDSFHILRDCVGKNNMTRIMSVALSQPSDSADKCLLGMTLDSGAVRVWKLGSDLDKVYENNLEAGVVTHTKHLELCGGSGKKAPRVGTFLFNSPDIFVSGDELGNLVILDTRVNSLRTIQFAKKSIMAMNASPHLPDVVAYGCQLGLVFVVDISGKGRILHKIRSHDEDIQSLSWSPVNLNIFSSSEKEEDGASSSNTESLFVVGSRDRTLSIWSAKTGHKHAVMSLKGKDAGRDRQGSSEAGWAPCFWVDQYTILFGDTKADLRKWALKDLKTTEDFPLARCSASEAGIVHTENYRAIFGIAVTGGLVHTTGYDRAYIVTELGAEPNVVLSLPTFANWAMCLAPNPMDNSLIAIGAGDGLIRLWRTAAKKRYDVRAISNNLRQAKIAVLAWHPEKENLLGFGTDEGRVGVIDLQAQRKDVTWANHQCRGKIYGLQWGRAAKMMEKEDTAKEEEGEEQKKDADGETKDSDKQKNDPDRVMLYSVGDSKLFMHDLSEFRGRSINLEKTIALNNNLSRSDQKYSEVCFHPDGQILALGADDGTIEILTLPYLKTACTIKSLQKLIQNLKWHPSSRAEDGAESKFKSWLAVGSNDADIHVFDLKRIVDEAGGEGTPTEVVTAPTLTLKGHLFRVPVLDWSPHEEGKLVSVSYDASTQIWDITDGGKPIANFPRHEGRMFCCCWHPTDPDFVLSAGDDTAMRGFKISEHTSKLPVKPRKRVVIRNAVPNGGNGPEPNGTTQLKSGGGDDTTAAKHQQEPRSDYNLSAAAAKKMKSPKKNYFPLSSVVEQARAKNVAEDCLLVKQFVDNDAKVLEDELLDRNLHLSFFFDDFTMEKALEKEAGSFASQNNYQQAAHLSLVGGDLKSQITTAMSKGQLTDWLVAAASSVSHKLWSDAAEAYAVQLTCAAQEGKEDPVKAAGFYLMINKVEEAVRVLKNCGQFKMAVSIVKLRLPTEKKLLQDLYRAWAVSAQTMGNHELAAKCWMAVGETLNAASFLAKRQDIYSLRVAAQLFKEKGENDKAKLLAIQCASQCQITNNYVQFEALLNEFEEHKEALLKYKLQERTTTEDVKEGEAVATKQEETVSSD